MSRRNNSFFDRIAQQHLNEVAALFAYFGINAEVNANTIKNAIIVYKGAFASKLAELLNGGKKEANFEGFGGKLGEFVTGLRNKFAENAKIEEEKAKDAKKIIGMPPALFWGLLLIVLLIVALILVKVLKKGK